MNSSDACLFPDKEDSREDVEVPLLAEGGVPPVNYTRALTQRSRLGQNDLRPHSCLQLFCVPDPRHYTAAVPVLSGVVFVIPGIVLVTSMVECVNFQHCRVSLSTTEIVSFVLTGISCILLTIDAAMNLKHWSARDTKKSETRHLRQMAFAIGLGALAYTVTETVSDNSCHLQDNHQSIVSLTYGILKCLFIALLLLSVCLHYNQTSHSYFCAIFVAVIVGVAASIGTLEIALAIIESSALNGSSANSHMWRDCVSADRYINFFTNSFPYLFPFLVQFLLLTPYLLFKSRQDYGKFTYQNTMDSLNRGDQYKSHIQLFASQGELSSQERDNSNYVSTGTQRNKSCCGKQTDVGMFVGIIWAIGFAVTIFVATFSESRKPGGMPTAYQWYYAVKISTGVVATLSAVVGSSILSSVISHIETNNFVSLRMRKRLSDMKSVDYWLSVISLLSLIVYQGFSLMAAAMYESPEKMGWSSYAGPAGWKTFDCAVRLLEALAQFFLIIRVTNFLGLKQHNLELRLNSSRCGALHVLQQFILFLISCNICLWASDGMFHVRVADHLPLELDYYSPFVWYLISHAFFPLEIFFHLHSATLLFKFWSCTITVYRSSQRQGNPQP